jgi:hypothetical protein
MILNYFYEALLARITATVPEIKHVDIFFGQYDNEADGNELPFVRPAVFIEFMPLEWDSYGRKKQEASAQFRIHVVSDVIEETDSTTSAVIRTNAHRHLLALDKLFASLHGFSDPTPNQFFNTISRTTIEPYIGKGEMIVHILTFKCRLCDVGAVLPIQHLTNVGVEIITEIA